MQARLPIAIAVGATLAVPTVASADVFVDVPRSFLGGPIAPALSVATADPDGAASRSPVDRTDGCGGEPPATCVVVGPDADIEPLPPPEAEDGPAAGDVEPPEVDPEDPDLAAPADGEAVEAARRRRPRTVAPPPSAELRAAFGGLRAPAAGEWLPWQRPTLRWARARSADYYNVQIFRGARRVLNGWSSAPRLRAPAGVLKQGRTYVWAVFPGYGSRRAGRFGPAIGRSIFEVTLRPRLVFRTPGGGGSGVVAEVRPHIPHATLRLRAPRSLTARVPRTVTVDARGRFALPLPKRHAERLAARLITRGTDPPVGLRG